MKPNCCCSFLIQSKKYTLYYQTKKITACSLFDYLASVELFPKFYFDHRDEDQATIAFGSLLEFQEIPQIKALSSPSFDLKLCGAGIFHQNDNNKPSPFSHCPFFFLPKFIVVQKSEQTWLTQYSLTAEFDPLPSSHNVQDLTSKIPSRFTRHYPNAEQWQRNIRKAIEAICDTEIKKVVLARASEYELDQPINPFLLLKKISPEFQNSTIYGLQRFEGEAFIGASPEVLYSLDSNILQTEALAGTCSIDSDKDLLTSSKEYDEFKFVSDYLRDQIVNFGGSTQKQEDRITTTGYLKHLYCEFQSNLGQSLAHQEIIKALFPSPALSGFPVANALQVIEDIEPFNRGWFAAPLGWVGEKSAQLIIAIRCALVQNKKLSLFVANGIVENSDPQLEWEELNTKLKPFYQLLGHENSQLNWPACH